MSKRKIWKNLYEETYMNGDGISVADIQGILTDYGPTDLVEIWKNEDDNECTIYIGRWRVESDEEELERIKGEKKALEIAARRKGVVITNKEYEELKEKAAMYDNLCK